MFNLEQSISQWRGHMLSAGLTDPDILDELESHLRQDWASRVQSGATEPQAFEDAAQAIGHATSLQQEFAKVIGKKWAWLKKLKTLAADAFDPVPALSAFSPTAHGALEFARHEAPRLNHGFIGTEHVLLGLLASNDGVVPRLIKKLHLDRETLKQQIMNAVSAFPPSKIAGPLPYTPRVKKSLSLAAREAKASHDASVGPEHIFLGLLLEGDGVAGRVLRDSGLTPETTRAEIKQELGRQQSGSKDEQSP